MSVVEVHDLTRVFGDTRAVDGVSFAFERGEIFGFIGPNGAGKSTTMRILAGLDIPTAGDCLVDGYSTVDDHDSVARLIGYMPDNYGTYPNMTSWEYLDFFARAYDLRGPKRERAVEDVVEFCQLGGLRDKQVTALSKGMKQRLCLGRCLLHDPDVLILDEPSAGLDPRARVEFRDLLRVLRDQGKAIFISSHILADLEELCDAVAIIELGQLVATGTVRDIKQRAREARDLRRAAAAALDGTAEADDEHMLEIAIAEPVERLAETLAEMPELDGVEIADLLVSARIRGGPAERAALLKRLVDRGLPICHFGTRDENLEDLFMHLTEGKVQ